MDLYHDPDNRPRKDPRSLHEVTTAREGIEARETRRGMVKITGAFKLLGEYDAILRFEIEKPEGYTSVMDALAHRVCRILRRVREALPKQRTGGEP